MKLPGLGSEASNKHHILPSTVYLEQFAKKYRKVLDIQQDFVVVSQNNLRIIDGITALYFIN